MIPQQEMTPADVIQRLVSTVINKHTPAGEYKRAMQLLAGYSALTEDVRRETGLLRMRRWWQQCNTVVSQKERLISEEWFWLAIHKETDDALEDWIVGKTIGTVQDEMLVIELNGNKIPVMRYNYASVMPFESFDGFFTLKHGHDGDSMAIGTFKRRLRY